MIKTAIAAQNNNEPDYVDICKNIDTKIPLIEWFKPLIEKYINYKYNF